MEERIPYVSFVGCFKLNLIMFNSVLLVIIEFFFFILIIELVFFSLFCYTHHADPWPWTGRGPGGLPISKPLKFMEQQLLKYLQLICDLSWKLKSKHSSLVET